MHFVNIQHSPIIAIRTCVRHSYVYDDVYVVDIHREERKLEGINLRSSNIARVNLICDSLMNDNAIVLHRSIQENNTMNFLLQCIKLCRSYISIIFYLK